MTLHRVELLSPRHRVFGFGDVFLDLRPRPGFLIGDAHCGEVERVVGFELARFFAVLDRKVVLARFGVDAGKRQMRQRERVVFGNDRFECVDRVFKFFVVDQFFDVVVLFVNVSHGIAL